MVVTRRKRKELQSSPPSPPRTLIADGTVSADNFSPKRKRNRKLSQGEDPAYKKGFKFDHVWPMLKDIEKFANNNKANGEEIGVTSDDRPIGVKKAKAKAKAKRKSNENYNTIVEQNRNLIEIIKKNASDRARASELKEENRILLTNLNSISNPELREFLQNEQNRIMQKRTRAQRSQHGEHGEGSLYQGSQGE